MKGATVLLTAWIVASCAAPADGPVTIATERSAIRVCPAARIGGRLVGDTEWGLALENAGNRSGAIWPHGYSARRIAGIVHLVDAQGNDIAHEGDLIHAGGSSDDDGTARVCFGITVEQSTK
jgi:hypothetical protein